MLRMSKLTDYGTLVLSQLAAQRGGIASAGQVADVHYVDLMRDPVGTIRSAYDSLGLEPPPDMGTRITSYLAARPATKYGVHRYAPGDFAPF